MSNIKLTTNLSEDHKKQLLVIAVAEGLDKIEYKQAIEFLIEDWRKRNDKTEFNTTSRK